MASVSAEAGPAQETLGTRTPTEGVTTTITSPPVTTPQSLAILFQPEVYHLLQIVKKYGPSTRFFSDENSMVPPYIIFTELTP